MKHCTRLMKDVDTQLPNTYMYSLSRDEGTTSRFEITLYNNLEDLNSGSNGTKIYSKQATKKIPFNDKYSELMEKI